MLKDLLRALKPTVDMPGEMLTSDTVLDAVSGALDNVSTSWAEGEIAMRDAYIDSLKAEIEEMRQDRTMNNPPQDEGDGGKTSNIIDNMAMLIRRLVRQVKKHETGNPVAEAATTYLAACGLSGSPLRKDGK